MSPSIKDRLLRLSLQSAALISGTLVLIIVGFLLFEALPGLRHIGLIRFFDDPSWHPHEDAAAGSFNLVPMMVGTLTATLGAILLALPLALLSSILLFLYLPPLPARLYERLIELLAGIPSVVYGFWGLVVLVPLIRHIAPPGASLLSGTLILALMILPTITLIISAAFATVPTLQLAGAAALGMSRVGLLRACVLPMVKKNIFTAILLGTGRALGETMAVLMVTGNIVQFPTSPLDSIRTLTANIALEMGYAAGDHRMALFVSALLLLALVTALVLAAEKVSGTTHASQ